MAKAAPLRPKPEPVMANTTNPPRSVATLATDTAVLPLDATVLIGLRLAPGGGRALLRLADGRVVLVANGTRIGRGVLSAIDESGVIVTTSGTATRHKLGEAW